MHQWTKRQVYEHTAQLLPGSAGVEIYAAQVDVTPHMAFSWLERNHPQNRPLKRAHVEKMASDMASGHWRLSHQPIGFDTEAHLIDGQNRLSAVFRAGLTLPFLVVFNLPSSACTVADLGMPRKASDIAAMNGHRELTPNHMATARSIALGFNGRQEDTPTKSQLVDFALRHLDAIMFAHEHLFLDHMRPNSAPLRALVARAWYTADRGDLARFCRVVKTGHTQEPEAESAAVTLRNFLLQSIKGGRAGQNESYAKASRALKMFLDMAPCYRLHAATIELFPLPPAKA